MVMGEATEATIAREHAMARDDERIRIGAAGLTDCAWRAVQLVRQLAVAACPTRRNGRNLLPDATLKRRSGRPQRQAEDVTRVNKVGADLACSFGGKRVARRHLGAWRQKADAVDLLFITLHAETEARRCNHDLVVVTSLRTPLSRTHAALPSKACFRSSCTGLLPSQIWSSAR